MAKQFTGTEGLEYYANIFFNMPTKEQDEWTTTKFGISARTFRRWCDKHEVRITKNVKLS